MKEQLAALLAALIAASAPQPAQSYDDDWVFATSPIPVLSVQSTDPSNISAAITLRVEQNGQACYSKGRLLNGTFVLYLSQHAYNADFDNCELELFNDIPWKYSWLVAGKEVASGSMLYSFRDSVRESAFTLHHEMNRSLPGWQNEGDVAFEFTANEKVGQARQHLRFTLMERATASNHSSSCTRSLDSIGLNAARIVLGRASVSLRGWTCDNGASPVPVLDPVKGDYAWYRAGKRLIGGDVQATVHLFSGTHIRNSINAESSVLLDR